MKISPQRTCMGCNTKKNKNELIRIVKDKECQIKVDKTGNADGRGAYLCCSKECLKKAIKTKRIEKVLKCKFDENIYEEIETIINNK